MIKNETMTLHSVGLYSSWCLKKNFRLLFDCGDGCAQILKKQIFAVENIFFSHAHVDHVAGLFSFIGLRNKTMGANDKELNIYYPENEILFLEYKAFAEKLFPKKFLKFDLNWYPIKAGDEIYVRKKNYVKSFKTKHNANSLGYVVCEESRRLKEEYSEKDIGKLIKEKKVSREDITERADIKHFAYTLDNCGFDLNLIKGVKEVVLDATFIDPRDRTSMTHCTFDEAKKIADELECEIAYLAHISPRYKDYREKIYTTYIKQKKEKRLN